MSDDERFVRLATAVMQVRDFLALHRKATGRSDVNIRRVLALLDDALLDVPPASARLIAPCPDCGDEFDVTDEDGRLRTERHDERHHASGPPASASPDRPSPPTGVQTMRRTGDVRAALRGG